MDFVKDWLITQVLGEGAYGEVKLLENKITGEYVAMKILNTRGNPNVAAEVKKEVAIHKCLRHPNIVQFYGSRSHGDKEYIFLEYAAHGALFDEIDPGIGMDQSVARKYMSQLLHGVDYLHSRGIAHRDIKPENLLLDVNDNLKISDFGLATMFRAKGKERALSHRCGTLPYVAPEVLVRPYAAQPADIWSCGIVLVAMLCGELPWNQASDDSADYKAWKNGLYMQNSPWNRVDNLSLALLRKILSPLPSARFTSPEIQEHKWFKQELVKRGKKKMAKRKVEAPADDDETDNVNVNSLSQVTLLPTSNHLCDESVKAFLSQPTYLDDMLVSTQLLNTQPSSAQNILQKLVRRMTRFTVNLTLSESEEELESALTQLNLNWTSSELHGYTINGQDRRKNQLVFKAFLMDIERGTFFDFRLSKGCGLEFKRYFVDIRTVFKETIIHLPELY